MTLPIETGSNYSYTEEEEEEACPVIDCEALKMLIVKRVEETVIRAYESSDKSEERSLTHCE